MGPNNPNRLRSVLLRNAGALVSTNVAGRIIRFAYLLAIARVLGPDQTGVFLYGIALYLSLTGLAHMGQNIFLASRIGRKTGSIQRIVGQSLTVTITAATLVSCGLLGYIWYSEPNGSTAFAISFFALALFGRVMVAWVRGVFVALEDATWIPRYETGFRTAEACNATENHRTVQPCRSIACDYRASIFGVAPPT